MKKISIIMAAVCMMIIAVSCSVGNDNNTNPQNGNFLLANISPDSKPLNVYLNGSPFGSGLSYGIYTPYYAATAGSYTFTFTDSANNTVLTSNVSIAATKSYSFYLVDSFSKLKPSFIPDDFAIPGADSVQIRFFNFSPNSQPLTLSDSAAGVGLYAGRTFNDQAIYSNYTLYDRKPAGVYTFQLKDAVAGTVLSSRKDTLSGGHVYTVFAKGFYNGTGVQALGIGQVQNY